MAAAAAIRRNTLFMADPPIRPRVADSPHHEVSACLRSLQRAGLELSANSAEHPTTIRRLLHVAANIPPTGVITTDHEPT